jgi:anion-transporting  ArsA/GET3 family ATPase
MAENSSAQKIHFVTGKGGVGKSVFASSLAYAKARTGERVLLLEIGETSYFKDFFNLADVAHDPIKSGLGFDIALWSGESCLREYILYYLKLERILSLFFENNVMRSLINVAPGLNEISILGKITSGIRKVGPALNYDRIVVDCYATGHAMALFKAPRGMMEAIRFGPMGKHSKDIFEVIQNPKICSYHIVSLLEEMPVIESLELRAAISAELGLQAQIFSNKTLHPPVENLDPIIAANEDVKEFAIYLKSVLARQEKYTKQIALTTQQAVVHELPLVFSSDAVEIIKACADLGFIRNL